MTSAPIPQPRPCPPAGAGRSRCSTGWAMATSSPARISREDEACETIRDAAEGEPLADPRILRFRPGRRSAIVEPQCHRRRPRQRIPRTAGIDVDLPCADGDHLSDRTVSRRWPDRPARPRRIQPAGRHGIRPGARFPDPALQRHDPRRFRILEPCAHDDRARQPGRQAGTVAQGGADREIFRRAVLRCQLDRGLCRAGPAAAAAR